MKYPLPKNLFPPLTLTDGQEEQYERLAHSLVKETMADYDHFWIHDKRVIDTARWKPIKRRENIVVYKDRARTRDSSVVTRGSSRGAATQCASARVLTTGNDFDTEDDSESNPLAQTMGFTSSAFSITDRSLQPETSNGPKLLAVGSIRGSLDDVMYGIASPNAASMRLKTSYVDDEIVDGAVLYQMKGPTPAEPFRFLGVKWMVKENQGAVKKFVRPRDFVVLEYSSVMLRPNGDRIGFHLMHSIEIPSCRELRDKNILRAKVSSCYLYRELSNGFVDLYMTAKVEPRGKVLESMAIRAAATALSSCWKSVSCAQSKKLAWLLQNDQHPSFSTATSNSRGSSRTYPTSGSSARDGFPDTRMSLAKKGCGVCSRSFGAFSKSSTCQLCYEQMCYRCRVYKKLSSETLDTMITKTAMVFCKRCIASVSDESASDIAKQEIWDGRYRSRTRASSATTHATGSSYANPSLYEGMYDPRASERSTYSSIFDERDEDDAKSIGRVSSVSRVSSRARGMSSPRAPRRSSVKQISWRLSGQVSLETVATDALSLAELDPSDHEDRERDDQPILLIEPATCVNLRAMDYVVPPQEEDDDLESITTSSVYQDSDDGRISYSSSIALMDADDHEFEPHTGFHPDLEEFRVDEEGEEEEDEEIVIVNSNKSTQERISEVHALVKAQSAIYETESTASSFNDDDVASYQSHRKQSYQMQLWMQMNDLRDAAENTYQVTKRNTETLLQQGTLGSDKARNLRSYSQPFQFGVVGLRPGRAMTVTAPKKAP